MAASWMVLMAAMEALGVPAGAGSEHARERLIVLDARGQVLRIVDGADGQVEFPADMAGLLAHAGARLTLVHNHPASNGLSPYDLAQLANPGIHAVVAIGHDGSVYRASRGTAFESGRAAGFEDAIYGPGMRTALRLQARQRDTKVRAAFDLHVHHVLSLALGEAGVIVYRSTLSERRRNSYADVAAYLARVQRAAREAIGAIGGVGRR